MDLRNSFQPFQKPNKSVDSRDSYELSTSKSKQRYPRDSSNYFKNKAQGFSVILSNYFKNQTEGFPEILSNLFKNKIREVFEILSKYFKNQTLEVPVILKTTS